LAEEGLKTLLIVVAFLYLPIIVFYGRLAFFSNFSIHQKLLIPTILDQYIDKPYDRDEYSYADNLDAVCKVPKLSVLTSPQRLKIFC